MMKGRLAGALERFPVVAILRGLQPERAAEIADVLHDAGFSIMEVPLNRPGAHEAIAAARAHMQGRMIVGAGTVVTRALARSAHSAGAELLVMPNLDQGVMEEGRALGSMLMPGVMTPSEVFAAVKLGADALKLFPAEVIGPSGLKALRSVMPAGDALFVPVGGVGPADLAAWAKAGADGFGAGSSLFQPGFSTAQVGEHAASFAAAWRRMTAG